MELLSARHRYSILQLGTTHLDGVAELIAFLTERINKLFQFGLHTAVHTDERIAESRGVGVIGTLRAVDMVVRRAVLVFAATVTHEFQRTVSNHFVGVHVNRCSGTSLNHVGGELVMHLTINQFAASLCNSGVDLIVDDA